MEKITGCGLFVLAVLFSAGTAHAGDYDWDDIWGPYTRRIDHATPSSGNAQNVNTATQIINPWPPYVRNRHIPGDGSRMVGAVKHYREPLSSSASSTQLQLPSLGTGGQTGGGNENGGTPPSGQD